MTQFQLQEKLAVFGIKADRNRIMTSAIAAAKYCRKMYASASVKMIGEKDWKKRWNLKVSTDRGKSRCGHDGN